MVCATCTLIFGCYRAETKKAEPTQLEKAEQQYAEWASEQPRPSKQLVRHIETLLAKEPCVGRLDRWARYYAYNYDVPEHVLYPEIVDFHLEEIGTNAQPAIHITEPNSWVNIDDRPIRMATGSYDVRRDKIGFAWCGNNVAGLSSTKTDIYRLDEYFNELDRRRVELRRTRAHNRQPQPL